jgi:hypothetical protein
MKVAGFSFIRNAVKYGYPIEEAIMSILPLCDVIYVAVGESDDDTRSLVQKLSSDKIIIIDTIWDDSLKTGGRVLAEETNKAFQAIPAVYDWAIYIQGDEMMHEQDYAEIRAKMKAYSSDPTVQGLLFRYKHFYGSFDYVATASKWYRKEIRIVKNDKAIFSYRDAQGFRIKPNAKLQVKPIDADIYHYGWVRPPEIMLDKINNFNKLYNLDQDIPTKENEFDYSEIDKLDKFDGSHPKVMQARVNQMNWKFEKDISFNKLSLKEKFRLWVEKKTGYMPWEYRNYKVK